jgi:peptidoglycan/xylan/chitin deacetylase (PgdA/CDA1 family)
VSKSGTTINLCFHGIGEPQRVLEPGEGDYWVSVSQFEELLNEIGDRPDVRLSFDDGNVSDVELALPRLRERGLTATFFLLAGRVGTKGSIGPNDVRILRREGMQIGSHGFAHRSWRHMDPAAEHQELVVAAEQLAELADGQPIREAACPLGDYDRGCLNALRARGYRHVYTSDRLPAVPDRWLQPRYSLRRSEDGLFLRGLLQNARPNPHTSMRAAWQMLKQWR